MWFQIKSAFIINFGPLHSALEEPNSELHFLPSQTCLIVWLNQEQQYTNKNINGFCKFPPGIYSRKKYYLRTLSKRWGGSVKFTKTFITFLKIKQSKMNSSKLKKKKLDHETWLCRTHLDDFLVKIWTILDHTRTRLNLVINDILFNLWSIIFRPIRTIWDH